MLVNFIVAIGGLEKGNRLNAYVAAELALSPIDDIFKYQPIVDGDAG